MGAGRPRWARHLVEIECRFAARHSRLMWVLADVVGLFSIIVGPFSPNVGRRQRIFSANLGPKRRMLSGRAVYVIGPLQLSFAALGRIVKTIYMLRYIHEDEIRRRVQVQINCGESRP